MTKKYYFSFSERKLKNFKNKSIFFLVLSIFLLIGIPMIYVTDSFNWVCIVGSVFLALSTTEFFFFDKFASGSIYYRKDKDKISFVNVGYGFEGDKLVKDISSNSIKGIPLALSLPLTIGAIFAGFGIGTLIKKYWILITSVIIGTALVILLVKYYFKANKKIVEGVVNDE